MDKRVDEILIKISGRTPIAHKLNVDDDVVIRITGQVVEEIAQSNQDGSVNLVYTIKPYLAEI